MRTRHRARPVDLRRPQGDLRTTDWQDSIIGLIIVVASSVTRTGMLGLPVVVSLFSPDQCPTGRGRVGFYNYMDGLDCLHIWT